MHGKNMQSFSGAIRAVILPQRNNLCFHHLMTHSSFLRNRLYNQQLVQHGFTNASDLVSWFGAMQAQDFAGAKWAIGLRVPAVTDRQVEQAIATKQIIRTWALRGT